MSAIKYSFAAGDGASAQGWEAIVPILRVDEFPKMTCIGTGFFVHTGGILATAAHVLSDLVNDGGTSSAGLMTLQFVPPKSMIRRNFDRAVINKIDDVALASLATITRKCGKEYLRNKVLVMTTRIPKVGDHVYTWAFPKSVSKFSERAGEVSIVPKMYEGQILKEYRGGRDSVMLPGRCYETSLGIENGASGGPVFDERGYVFGINSTGINGADTAFVSHVQGLGGLPVRNVMTTDGELHEAITLGTLIDRNEIPIVSEGGSSGIP